VILLGAALVGMGLISRTGAAGRRQLTA